MTATASHFDVWRLGLDVITSSWRRNFHLYPYSFFATTSRSDLSISYVCQRTTELGKFADRHHTIHDFEHFFIFKNISFSTLTYILLCLLHYIYCIFYRRPKLFFIMVLHSWRLKSELMNVYMSLDPQLLLEFESFHRCHCRSLLEMFVGQTK